MAGLPWITSVASVALLGIVGSAVASEAATCPGISGDRALVEAGRRGFGFNVLSMRGAGSCEKVRQSVIIAAGRVESVSCEIEFFAGRRLNPRWRLKEATFEGSDWEYIKGPDGSSTDAKIVVRAKVTRGESTTFKLATITLEGPSCPGWADAFETSTESAR
jgi:hypothetical protein